MGTCPWMGLYIDMDSGVTRPMMDSTESSRPGKFVSMDLMTCVLMPKAVQ